MKKVISVFISCVLCISSALPAFAYNYDFESGSDTLMEFGKQTSSDSIVIPDVSNENTRRNKDASFSPPPYFYGSGDIPTDPSSLYHDNAPNSAAAGSYSESPSDGVASIFPSANSIGGITGSTNSSMTDTTAESMFSSTFTLPLSPGAEASTSIIAVNTEPLYYSDGSIGTLHIARTGKTIKVYEGEQLSNLKKGAGHFTSTSTWDGNVAMCGHNRGSSAYFSFVKDMQTGDKVTYTTRYGTRTYEVFSKEQISEYDYSKLSWSADNYLTLITCIAGIPGLRWAAILREVR